MSKTRPQQDLNKKPAGISALVFVLLGFLVSYLLFFICPVFLNSTHLMQHYAVVPRETPIGIDLQSALDHCKEVFITKTNPYTGSSLFPPLTYIIFGPFLAVDLSTAYLIITIISLICYIFITFLFPLWTNRQKPLSPLLILFFVSGLFSYGFQFEIERGQFNVISMFLSLSAVLIYHNYHRFRYLAYGLFSIAVQFKIYPAIFIFMFVRDWRDWKNNIKRFLGLGAFNFALLFILGPGVFVNFVKRVMAHMADPFIWIGNHSIRSFATVASTRFSWWAKEDLGLVQCLLAAFVAVCIFLIIVQAYRQNKNGINPYLLLGCTIAAMVIPSESHDYKLSILTAPVALAFHNDYFAKIADYRSRRLVFLLIFVFSFAYSSTLYTYNVRYQMLLFMVNNLPALMILLFITTVFSLMNKPGKETYS